MEGRCSDVLRLGVMVNYIRSDESLQVLIFVVLPLVLLLVTGIFLRIRYTPPSTAKFSNFSVSLSSVGREDAYIVYRDNGRRLEFYVGPGDRKKELYLAVPKELPDQIINELVPNLARGLAKLRFQKYKIIKKGDTRVLATGPRAKNGDNS
jgi:hypothetical protein